MQYWGRGQNCIASYLLLSLFGLLGGAEVPYQFPVPSSCIWFQLSRWVFMSTENQLVWHPSEGILKAILSQICSSLKNPARVIRMWHEETFAWPLFHPLHLLNELFLSRCLEKVPVDQGNFQNSVISKYLCSEPVSA